MGQYSTIEDNQNNPALGDIDNDGNLEIVYPSYDGKRTYPLAFSLLPYSSLLYSQAVVVVVVVCSACILA